MDSNPIQITVTLFDEIGNRQAHEFDSVPAIGELIEFGLEGKFYRVRDVKHAPRCSAGAKIALLVEEVDGPTWATQ